MKFRNVFLLVTVSLIWMNCSNQEKEKNISKMITMTEKKEIQPPVAKKVKHEMSIHGDTRNDEYYWMRLSDEQKNAEQPDNHYKEVVGYLDAENAYTKKMTAHTEKFQEELFKEIVGRIKQDDSSCLLYTSPSPRDATLSRMPSSA